MAVPGPLCLHAIVPAGDPDTLRATMRGLHLVPCGPVIAITGKPSRQTAPRAALRHDRIIGRALASCSSVVPFRLGVELGSEAELHRVLAANLDALSAQLARFAGRVEMGFKARLAAQPAGSPMHLPPGLDRVRALAPRHDDCKEQLKRAPSGHVFEGCYLILRQAIEAFWSVVEDIRRAAAGMPVLGSGPWAAYTFCDLALRPAQIEAP